MLSVSVLKRNLDCIVLHLHREDELFSTRIEYGGVNVLRKRSFLSSLENATLPVLIPQLEVKIVLSPISAICQEIIQRRYRGEFEST